VAGVNETVLRCHPARPALDGGPLYFDGATAGTTNQVVVVASAAPAVNSLPVCCAERVDFARLGERLQRPVDRRQPDRLASVAQHRMQVLRASKLVKLVEDG